MEKDIFHLQSVHTCCEAHSASCLIGYHENFPFGQCSTYAKLNTHPDLGQRLCGALEPQCFMPSLSKGKTVALKRHHIIWKTKLKFCSNVPNTASSDSQIFYIKAIDCGKMIQHKYYGSAFIVAEHMYLSCITVVLYVWIHMNLLHNGRLMQWIPV
jgi:hypothetical protein